MPIMCARLPLKSLMCGMIASFVRRKCLRLNPWFHYYTPKRGAQSTQNGMKKRKKQIRGWTKEES
jgi:hypothetical protein